MSLWLYVINTKLSLWSVLVLFEQYMHFKYRLLFTNREFAMWRRHVLVLQYEFLYFQYGLLRADRHHRRHHERIV